MALPSGGAGDPVLTAERDHLRLSREFLRLMRENVLSLRAMGGDPVSEEYLKADLFRRAQALIDLPDTPLFFGRLDYADSGEQFHIGRRHVHDPDGRPVVIDWRAPVSRPFYRASPAEPMGVAHRRRFGFSGGELTAYEDEDLSAAAPLTGTSRILIEEIERPRSGPMRDIVATIQPDQDDIVRAEADASLCVQGAPGTGKTAVGLHRIAYLLYAHPERMTRGGVLVIGPNRAFLGYIRNVLPALGELDVTQQSVTDLLAAVPVRAADTDEAGRVKGDARMAEVLRRALWEQLAEPSDAITVTRGSRRWRVPASELAELADELRVRGVRYAAGRDMLSHRIAHVVLTRMEASGESCDDRTHEAVRRTAQVRAAVDVIWPKDDPVRLVFRLLSDPDLLARAGEGVLSPAEQAAISWAKPPRGPGSARWTAADAVLVDEAQDLMWRTPSLAHVVVDEAQDLSPMQCRAIGRRCATGSATVLGDIAQGTTAWAAASWQQVLGDLGKDDAGLRVLDTGYRVPRQILDFASRLLGHIAPGLDPARSVRQDPGSLVITAATGGTLPGLLQSACADVARRPGSAAVIAADDQLTGLSAILRQGGCAHSILDPAGDPVPVTPDPVTTAPAAPGPVSTAAAPGTVTTDSAAPGPVSTAAASAPASTAPASTAPVTLVPVTLAKGLEFDHVIVVEPARIAAAEARGLQRLYVALTRAVSRLTVLHTEPLPAPLR